MLDQPLATSKMIAEKDGPIGRLIFNNPARHNAVSLEMWEAVTQIMDDFEQDDAVRVIVVSGAGGRAFVSGADISEFKEKRASEDAVAAYGKISEGARRRIQDTPKPTIAMISGYCIGGGVGTALACDLRIAAEGSRFGIPAAKLGLGYAYDGIKKLIDLVGPACAREIFYTARQFSAEEALRMGLINQVVPADQLEGYVKDYCEMIAANAPLTVRSVKVIVREAMKDASERDLALCKRLVDACFASEDYAEGRTAFMEKRKPVFKGGKPMKLPTHSRYDYIPIHKRSQYEWPEGARLAITICSNIEYFAFGAGLGVDPSGVPASQSHRNFAWRDYGNRVGVWHYLDLLDEFGLPGAHNVNSAVLEACPDIVERLRGRGDEFVGHGRTNAEHQDALWEEDEARLIAECTDVVTRLSGRRPEGWLGPGLAESRVTPDLLKEAGYRYVMDWPMDDQPIWMRTRAGPILSVPYPTELNDLPALVNRRHSGRQFAEMIIDQFDEMLEQSRKYPLVFAVAVHPFIIGQPYRLRAFRDAIRHIMRQHEALWITTPGEIARYCESLPEGTVPGSD